MKSKYIEVSKLYNIVNVNNGDIETLNGIKNIYKVSPCRIIEDREEMKEGLYNCYISLLKMIDFDYQIIIESKIGNFKEMFDILESNKYLLNNVNQRKLVSKYQKFLMNMTKEAKIYNQKFYLVVNKLNEYNQKKLEEGFYYMKEYGINISKINNEKELIDILYYSINKY